MSNDDNEYQRLLTMYNNTTNPFIKAELHEKMEKLNPNDNNGIIFLGMKYANQDKNDDTYYFPNRNTNYQVPIRDEVNKFQTAKNNFMKDIDLESFRLTHLIELAIDEVIEYYKKRINSDKKPYEVVRSIEHEYDVPYQIFHVEEEQILNSIHSQKKFEEVFDRLNKTLNKLCRDADKLIRDGKNIKTDI